MRSVLRHAAPRRARLRRLAVLGIIGLTSFSPAADAEVARGTTADCRDYCGEKAAEKCEDVTSTWCNVYILGCLAGCGVSHL